MLKICLVFWKSEPQYAYKRYAYKKTCIALERLVQKRKAQKMSVNSQNRDFKPSYKDNQTTYTQTCYVQDLKLIRSYHIKKDFVKRYQKLPGICSKNVRNY